MNGLPTPQRGQVWRNKYTGSTYEVLDDRRTGEGWPILVTTLEGAQWVGSHDLRDGRCEPPRPEIATYWVNVYAPAHTSSPHRGSGGTDAEAAPGRVCRVPLIPDWDGAVYDEEQRKKVT